MNDTREQLLNVAERLFAERGVDAVSLREITSSAGANVASIHYYFGSKDVLIREVFRRRLEPLNEERMQLLTRFEERAGGHPSIEQIMFAFIHPVIRRMSADPAASGNLMRLMAHVHSDVNAKLAEMVLRDMESMIGRFIEAARRAMPELSIEDIFWRSHFATGVMAHTAAAAGLLRAFSGGVCSFETPEELSYRVVAFVAAGFRADTDAARSAVGPMDVEVSL